MVNLIEKIEMNIYIFFKYRPTTSSAGAFHPSRPRLS